MASFIERRWYADAPPPALLKPLAALFGAVAANRRARLQAQAPRLDVPVIVVGNISLGGTGKTPFTIWLVQRLQEWGFRPGVISRGYGARAPHYPYRVRPDSRPTEAGDEPLLIALRTGVPVMIDPDRVAAARALIASGEIDMVVADDGLQHYRLARDLEICVVDGQRGFGNGALLPAGPLREPQTRLQEIPLVVVNGGNLRLAHPGRIDMHLQADLAVPMLGGEGRALSTLRGQTVHALAGIGHPTRFFSMLEHLGVKVIAHAFSDHHALIPEDISFADGLPVLMTEKDAVKCRAFAGSQHYAVPVSAQIDAAGLALVQQSCARLKP